LHRRRKINPTAVEILFVSQNGIVTCAKKGDKKFHFALDTGKGGCYSYISRNYFAVLNRRERASPVPRICLKAGKWSVQALVVGFFAPWGGKIRNFIGRSRGSVISSCKRE
jgi:hypothetical protein